MEMETRQCSACGQQVLVGDITNCLDCGREVCPECSNIAGRCNECMKGVGGNEG